MAVQARKRTFVQTHERLNNTLAKQTLVADQRGAVFVEFIISFIPMFVFFLGITQLAFSYATKIVVQHAAYKAVRAAIFLGITQLAFSYATKIVVQHAAYKAVRAAIIAEPEPKRDCKDGEGDQGGNSSGGSGGLQNPFSESPKSDSEGQGKEPKSDNPLVNKVRAAAYLPLSTVAPPVAVYPAVDNGLSSIAGGLGQYTTRFAAGYFVYNRSHAGVTFRDAEGKVFEPEKLEAGPVTIHVSYLHYCMIPLVSRFMCNPLYDLGGIGRAITGFTDALSDLKNINFEDTINSKGANITEAANNVQNASERIQESIDRTEHVYGELLNAEYPALLLAWADPKHRFQMIESEATLPFQFASYVDQCQDAKK